MTTMGRPDLSTVPEAVAIVEWYEQATSEDGRGVPLEHRLVKRQQRVIWWACGVCGAEGRMWEGEPPSPTPQRRLECKAAMSLAPRRYAIAKEDEPGCPVCASEWQLNGCEHKVRDENGRCLDCSDGKRCGHPTARRRNCPYAADVGNDPNQRCTCCDDCANECSGDI